MVGGQDHRLTTLADAPAPTSPWPRRAASPKRAVKCRLIGKSSWDHGGHRQGPEREDTLTPHCRRARRRRSSPWRQMPGTPTAGARARMVVEGGEELQGAPPPVWPCDRGVREGCSLELDAQGCGGRNSAASLDGVEAQGAVTDLSGGGLVGRPSMLDTAWRWSCQLFPLGIK